MEKITEVFVILEDKPGSLSNLTKILKKKNISIHAIGLFIDSAGIYVSDPKKALETILENGLQAELRDVLKIILPNRAGMLHELTQKLGKAGININNLYSTLHEKQKDGLVILEVDNMQLAIDIFKNHKF